jgi:predicted transposase/invertase (TIGR01784 family)
MNKNEQNPNKEDKEHRFDRNWKDVVMENFEDALSFFLPELAADLDRGRELIYNKSEFERIGGQSDKGRVNTDLCVTLPLKSGETPRALFIFEQQHENGADFQKRVFESWYRALDKHQLPVTSMAVYTGKTKPSDTYSVDFEGTVMNFKFNAYGVDEQRMENLKRDKRHFAIPVLASKMAVEAGGSPEKRGEYALELIGVMKEHELDEKRKNSYRNFAYNVLQLGKEDIAPKVKEAWNMDAVPLSEVVRDIQVRRSWQEGIEQGIAKGIEQGKAEGIEQGKAEVALNLLSMGLPAEQVARGTGFSLEELNKLTGEKLGAERSELTGSNAAREQGFSSLVQAAKAVLGEGSIITNAQGGRTYTGEIVKVVQNYAVQKISAGMGIFHNLGNLDVPDVVREGAKGISITYDHERRGSVKTAPREAGRESELSR